MPIPRTLSASQMQVAVLCKMRWLHEYVMRTPDFSNPAADVGTAVHAGLEMFVKAVYIDKTHADLTRPKQKELLITFYQMGYVQTFGTADMETVEYKDGFDLSMRWFARTDLRHVEVESAELKETIPIPYNHPDGQAHSCDLCADKGMIGDGICYIPFNYIMDRVDKTGPTSYEVVDYKTIRVPLQPEDLDEKIQARAYALAIQIKHPDAERIKVTFDLLRHEKISLSMSKQDNINFWHFLVREAQDLVNLQEGDIQPTLNKECKFCVMKATCPELQKNIDGGGIHSLSVDEAALLLAKVENQKAAQTALATALEEVVMRHAADIDMLEWETADGSTKVEVGLTAARRKVDAHQAAEIMGPELFAQMGNMTVGNLEKIIKDESLDPEMRDRLKNTMDKTNGNLKVFVKPKSKLI
jgi:hypothetical protein